MSKINRLLPVIALTTSLILAGCGSSGNGGDASATTTNPSTTTQSVAGDGESTTTAVGAVSELEGWQADLNAVGCFTGATDGQPGPQTTAAIKRYQEGAGLVVDGKLGDATKAALAADAEQGTKVCKTTTTTSTTAVGKGSTTTSTAKPSGTSGTGSASLSSGTYSNRFALSSCKSATESSITFTGTGGSATIAVSASGSSGTLKVAGSGEGGPLSLDGKVTAVTVGDTGSFSVSGTYTGQTAAGEAFTVSGTCR